MKLVGFMPKVANSYNLSVAMGPVVTQTLAWGYFFSISRSTADSPVLIVVLLSVVATAIYLTTRTALLKYGLTWHLAYSLLNTFVLLVVYFAILYWSFGARGNFNIALSRIDAIYFALGTLSTAGTGSIVAESQLARGLVSIQMLFDFLFVAATVTIAITHIGQKATK